jgi:hypothetical protein
MPDPAVMAVDVGPSAAALLIALDNRRQIRRLL